MLTMGFCMVCARLQVGGDFQGKFSKEIKKMYNCVCICACTMCIYYVYGPTYYVLCIHTPVQKAQSINIPSLLVPKC